jgi:hypothetical protein
MDRLFDLEGRVAVVTGGTEVLGAGILHHPLLCDRGLQRGRGAASGCRWSLVTHYQDGAVGVANHGVGDAAHQRSPYAALAPAAHDYQAGVEVLAEMN